MNLFQILGDTIANFRKNDGFNRAAAISFYAFFSLIPVMILLTSVLGLVFGSRAGLLDKVIAMTKENFPYMGDRVISDLRGLSRSWMAFEWLSIVMLVWSAEMVFNSVAKALTSIFDVSDSYGFFKRKLYNILVLIVGVAAAIVSIGATAGAKLAMKANLNATGVPELTGVFHRIIVFAIKNVMPFGLMVVAVLFVYRVFAGGKLNLRYALYGSLLFTSLWEGAKQIFAWYVYNFPNYNRFYGSLGTIMMLLAWFFFSAVIFLMSASFAAEAYKLTLCPGEKERKQRVAPDNR